jgi:aldehyde:ferredoxin oxidoreductase
MCGFDQPAAVLAAARACGDAGIHTFSTRAIIAFLMQCAESGLVGDQLEPSQHPLRFGDGAAMCEAVDALVAGRGTLGELLALGSRRAAERIGGEALTFAPHVNGLELPGYDPRSLHTMALGLAVGTRGADHNRSGADAADFSERTDRRQGGAPSAALAIETEDRAADYYQEHGWDREGRVPSDLRRELGLDDPAFGLV